jgi:hypothetical protein
MMAARSYPKGKVATWVLRMHRSSYLGLGDLLIWVTRACTLRYYRDQLDSQLLSQYETALNNQRTTVSERIK